ncbi:MAG: outer membrane beta-barrel protein, partial [Prevotellaceae bacterium]|nr:outer membrane beta-barrel protein [Prevotellaceae bacterium]
IYIQPFVRLNQSYNASGNDLYRLDRLADYTETAYPLGVLPSTRNALLHVIDATNSYQNRSHVTSSFTGLTFNYTHGDGTSRPQYSAQLYAPVQFKRESLSYNRMRHYHSKRNSVFFEPTLTFTYQNTDSTGTRYASINYGTSQSQPDLSTMLAIHDDSNPLVLTLGNPNLKKSRDHHIDLMLSSFSMARQLSANAGASYHTMHNAIATSVLYDKNTGRTTTQQVNVNGNWGASLNGGMAMPLDKSQHLSFQEELRCDYTRSVDLMTVSGMAAVQSKVNNWNVLNTLKLTWQAGDRIRLNCTSNVAYQRATGNRDDFTTVSAWRYNFGVNGNITLPWNFEITTDFTNYNRRGYNDSQMNSSELIWNLRLTKKLLKDNLTLSLDGFDLLGQLNNTTFTLDAQGRTETWTSSIPRYLMLHVAYKFHK